MFFLVKSFVLKDCVYYSFIMSRKCLNHPENLLICVCSNDLQISEAKFTLLIKKCYDLYFWCKVGDQHKSWAPLFCCVMCVKFLTEWINCTHQMPFSVPMVWKKQKDHSSNCYFCFTNITGIMSDIRLPPQSRRELHSSVQWVVVIT